MSKLGKGDYENLVDFMVDCEFTLEDLEAIAKYATGPLLKALEDEMQKQDEAKAEKHYEDFSDQYAMGSDGILTHLEEA
tara:strand:+ start:421 stop:657 length:237 start_codon:yes stop_codon:yes gene_type:complete